MSRGRVFTLSRAVPQRGAVITHRGSRRGPVSLMSLPESFWWLQADTNGVVVLKGTDWLVFCNPRITHVVFQFAAVEDFGEFGAFDQVQEWDIGSSVSRRA